MKPLSLLLSGVFAVVGLARAAEDFTPQQLQKIDRRIEEALSKAQCMNPEREASELPVVTRKGIETKSTQKQLSGIDPKAGPRTPDLILVDSTTESESARQEIDTKNATSPEAQATKFLSKDTRPMSVALGGTAAQVPIDRSAGSLRSAVEIHASSDKTTAEILVGLANSSVYVPSSDSLRETSWSLKGSAPIDNKDKGSASFATLDGLASGLTIGTALTISTTPAPTGSDIWDICKDLGWDTLSKCSSEKLVAALQDSKESNHIEALNAFIKRSRASTVYTLGTTLGHQQYKYFSQPLLAKATDSKFGWSVGGSVGRVNGARTGYFGGGFDFVHAYKELDQKIVCQQGEEESFDCLQGRFGPPKSNIGRLLYLEARSALFRLPFSVRVTHDIASDNSSIDIPIYLLTDKESNFNGGFRFGWTDSDHFTGGIFVGTKFDVSGSN